MSKHNLLNSNTPVVQFARERMAGRKDQIEKGISVKPSGPGPERRDFLSRFIDARGKDPEFISEQRVLALTVANMFAGSDTTAISLRAIFYNLLMNPSAMSKLLAELAAESESGRFTKNQDVGNAGLVGSGTAVPQRRDQRGFAVSPGRWPSSRTGRAVPRASHRWSSYPPGHNCWLFIVGHSPRRECLWTESRGVPTRAVD